MKTNITLIATLLLISTSHIHGTSWAELFKQYEQIIPQNSITSEQFNAYSQGTSPIIIDPAVKAITIVENNEPLVDVRTIHNPRIQLLPDPSKHFEAACFNSGFECSGKMRKTVYEKLEKMITNIDSLSPQFGYEAGQISIRLFEGLRSIATQTMIFSIKVAAITLEHPSWTEQEAETEASKWVAPVKNNTPPHSTGGALDIRLWDNKKEDFIDLGIFGAFIVKNTAAPTFSESLSDEIKKNRLLLVLAAEQAELINYSYEFWHYSSGDRYAAYWQEKDPAKRISQYGSL